MLKAPNFLQSFRSSPTSCPHYMIDGVDVTSTFRLGPIHDAQAYICCVYLVRQRLHLDDNAARVIGEDIWQRAQALWEDEHGVGELFYHDRFPRRVDNPDAAHRSQ